MPALFDAASSYATPRGVPRSAATRVAARHGVTLLLMMMILGACVGALITRAMLICHVLPLFFQRA